MCGDCANVMTIFMVYVSLFSAVIIDDAIVRELNLLTACLSSNLVWVSLSLLCLYKTNFFKQLWENPEVNQFFL